ncbi:putative hydroxymethylpyrimidine transporter CytX [Bacillaceae bacterium]
MAKQGTALGNDSITPTPMHERSLSFFGTFAMWLAANFVITTVMTGMFFVPDLPYLQSIWVILIGSAIGAVPLALMGKIGTRTGLPTMVITRAAFGQKGAILPAVVNTVVLVGWSWIQAYMAGLSLDHAVRHLTGYSNINLFTILTEALVVAVTIYGHRGIEKTEKFVSVAMLLLSLAVFYKLFVTYDVASLLEMKARENPATTVAIAFDIVVATAFSWMSSVCDYNRYCQSEKSGMLGTFSGYVLASLVAMGLGATVSGFSLLTGVEQTYDPTVLLAAHGFGLVAAIVVFFSVLSTNVMALYSATMSLLNVLPRVSFWKLAFALGVICTLGALLKEALMENFLNFVLMVGTLFIPVFAIVLVDYFVVKKGYYAQEEIISDQEGLYRYHKGFNWAAYASYVVGALFAYYFTYVEPLSVGATILTFLLTALVYVALMKITHAGEIKAGVTESSHSQPHSPEM